MFRVRADRAPAARVLRSYFSTSARAGAWFRRRGSFLVFGFLSDDEGGDWEIDGEGELSSIVAVRSDLAAGGLRVLYLGWLLRAQTGDVAEDAQEPKVPAGLAKLTAAETALVEFLRIDPDLIAAATQRDSQAAKVRTAGQLLAMAKARRQAAEQRAARKAQREMEKRAAAEAAIRARYLRALAAREAEAWREVEDLVQGRKPAAYDQAVVLLQDLRELCGTTGRSPHFVAFIDDLRRRHAAKSSFWKRLDGPARDRTATI